MSAPIKRYDAVHIRYEESNIRYGEGCEVEMVTLRDHIASHVFDIEAERALFEASGVIGRLYRCNTPGSSSDYEDYFTEYAWKSWKACAKSRAERFTGGAE